MDDGSVVRTDDGSVVRTDNGTVVRTVVCTLNLGRGLLLFLVGGFGGNNGYYFLCIWGRALTGAAGREGKWGGPVLAPSTRRGLMSRGTDERGPENLGDSLIGVFGPLPGRAVGPDGRPEK